jgi:thioredoxin 1
MAETRALGGIGLAVKGKRKTLMKNRMICLAVFFCLFGALLVQAEEEKGRLPEVPTIGMVTMLDLGAKKCIPCKMMAPILEKLKKHYEGRASIIFIDVWKHEDQIKKYGIRAIPTQIFYDEKGNEVYRNVGFMGEKAIIRQLEKMGVSEGKTTGDVNRASHKAG